MTRVLFVVALFAYAHAFRRLPLPRSVSRCTSLCVSVRGQEDNTGTSVDVLDVLLEQREMEMAFEYLTKNPERKLNEEQKRALLANLDFLSNQTAYKECNTESVKLEKFYARLGLSHFGSYALDSPLSHAELYHLESSPENIEHYTSLDAQVFVDLFKKLPVWSGKTLKQLNDAKEQETLRGLVAAAAILPATLALLQHQFPLLASEFPSTSTTTLACLAFGAPAIIKILDSPVLFNSFFERGWGWVRAATRELLAKDNRRLEARRAAATFYISYVLGVPIQNVAISSFSSSTRKRFLYADAPRVQFIESQMSVLAGKGKLTTSGLKRCATLLMANAAMDAWMTGKVSMSKFLETYFAALAQRAASKTFSTIASDSFPKNLCPTMVSWGLVEGMLILKESPDGLVDQLADIFSKQGIHDGSSVMGDAIFAIEAAVAAERSKQGGVMLPVEARKLERKAKEEAEFREESSISKILLSISRAKAIETPKAKTLHEEMGPIERIEGTDRVYTLEEIILHPNPQPGQVKELAKMVMEGWIKEDKANNNGKVLPKTQEAIKVLTVQVMEALRVHASKDASSSNSGADPKALVAADRMRAYQMIMEMGLAPDQTPAWVSDFCSRLALDENMPLVKEFVGEYVRIANAWQAAFRSYHSFFQFSTQRTLDLWSGEDQRRLTSNAWESANMNTGIERGSVVELDSNSLYQPSFQPSPFKKAGLAESAKELQTILENVETTTTSSSSTFAMIAAAKGINLKHVGGSAEGDTIAQAILEALSKGGVMEIDEEEVEVAVPSKALSMLKDHCGAQVDALNQLAESRKLRSVVVAARIDELHKHT